MGPKKSGLNKRLSLFCGERADDSTSFIRPHKLRSLAEKGICSFITTTEGHNHVITPTSKAEKLQDLADRL